MRFALVEHKKSEAKKGLKGLCPLCQEAVSAKCGEVRMHHWAHKANYNCDPWWDNETEWHRAWKDKYPEDWQEVALSSPSGEKHFADVQTDLGLTIEFQNSPISSDERTARELFYGRMIWVVNGNKRPKDYARFKKSKAKNLIPTNLKSFYLVYNPENFFPTVWLNRKVPVAFDFSIDASNEMPEIPAEPLWYLLPERIEGCAIVVQMSREAFVSATCSRSHFIPDSEMLNSIQNWFKTEFTSSAQISDLLKKENRSAECTLSTDTTRRLMALRDRFIGETHK